MDGDAPHAAPERPAGLDASTLAEAFQLTAAAHPDRAALRLKDDEFSISWGEYADKVRRVAAGLAGLGLERGDAMAIMLTNRPEFHWFDAAALHLGATPFSVYNTYSAEQIQYQVQDAEARIVVTEKAFVDRVGGLEGMEHLIVVDDEAGRTWSRTPRDGLRLRGGLARRRARRRAHADLHVGHHRSAQGRAAHALEPDRGRAAASTR